MGRLIINGNQVYEVDEACLKKKQRMKKRKDAEKKQKKGKETQNRNH